jgi:NAD+ synthase
LQWTKSSNRFRGYSESLAGLSKRRVRAIAEHFGAPSELVLKVPTADLESDAPLHPDEEVYGVTYEDINNFLVGKPVTEPTRQRILKTYRTNGHKRGLPVMPTDGIAG